LGGTVALCPTSVNHFRQSDYPFLAGQTRLSGTLVMETVIVELGDVRGFACNQRAFIPDSIGIERRFKMEAWTCDPCASQQRSI
jgi:hypothetical protein